MTLQLVGVKARKDWCSEPQPVGALPPLRPLAVRPHLINPTAPVLGSQGTTAKSGE